MNPCQLLMKQHIKCHVHFVHDNQSRSFDWRVMWYMLLIFQMVSSYAKTFQTFYVCPINCTLKFLLKSMGSKCAISNQYKSCGWNRCLKSLSVIKKKNHLLQIFWKKRSFSFFFSSMEDIYPWKFKGQNTRLLRCYQSCLYRSFYFCWHLHVSEHV